MIMVEDVLTIVRKTEDEAENIISKAKAEAGRILDKADARARQNILDLESKGKSLSEEIIGKAKVEGEKESKEIVAVEKKKATKLETSSVKKLEAGVALIVDSVLNVGGD
jgi:V/A-type H+-transporting ATPase subunit G/H